MPEIVPVPLVIHLPPNAQLPRMREILDDLCGLLERALLPAVRFKPEPGKPENDVRLACVMHAFNALDAGRAIYTLSGTDYAGTVAPHFRTIFEALVKIRWMRKHPPRARSFLLSEPFERYALATARVKKSTRWPMVVDDCRKAVEKNPVLLNLPNVTKGPNKRPDFRAIAMALRMPDLAKMAGSLGMDAEDYLIDHAVPSLTPHTSVVHVKSYAKRMNPDGTITMSTEMDPTMLLGYVARSATRLGEVLNEVLELYPDGKVLYDSEKVAETLVDVTTMLRNSALGKGSATD
jgi:hypothetical protein